MHNYYTVYFQASFGLRSLSTCLQPKILSDNVLDDAIDRRLGVNKVILLYGTTSMLQRKIMYFKFSNEYLL